MIILVIVLAALLLVQTWRVKELQERNDWQASMLEGGE